MACVPRLDEKWPEVAVELKAQQASFGSGCAYYERCKLAGKDEACTSARPPLVEVEAGHLVACSHIQNG